MNRLSSLFGATTRVSNQHFKSIESIEWVHYAKVGSDALYVLRVGSLGLPVAIRPTAPLSDLLLSPTPSAGNEASDVRCLCVQSRAARHLIQLGSSGTSVLRLSRLQAVSAVAEVRGERVPREPPHERRYLHRSSGCAWSVPEARSVPTPSLLRPFIMTVSLTTFLRRTQRLVLRSIALFTPHMGPCHAPVPRERHVPPSRPRPAPTIDASTARLLQRIEAHLKPGIERHPLGTGTR